MTYLFTDPADRRIYLREAGQTIHIPTMDDVKAYKVNGAKDLGEVSPEMAKRLIQAGSR